MRDLGFVIMGPPLVGWSQSDIPERPDFSLWCLFLVSRVMRAARVKMCVWFSEGGGINRVPETQSLYTGPGIHFKIKLTLRKQMFS